jgi:tetraacyldisaccharide 4'-kinase
VRVDSDPRVVGDEAVLLAQRCGRPVCVGPDRPAAVQALLAHTDCDIVISDDGLQHYALGRDLEIVVIDGQRRFGNRLLLPAGPLREPVSRLRSADLVICNGKPHHGEHAMRLRRPRLLPLRGNAPPVDIERLRGRRVRAIAGIGNPQRFFDLLRRFGLQLETHVFPDHHAYVADDLAFDPPMPLLMTEKDAVKCRHLAPPDSWVLRIEVQPDAPFLHRLGLAVEDFHKP